MNLDVFINAGCEVIRGAPLSRYTTFRLGGPCPALISCAAPESLVAAAAALSAMGLDYLLIGGGSNLLVADGGLRCVVVRYYNEQPVIRRDGDLVEVSGATLLDNLAAWSVGNDLEGLAFASGIPGTVGGAIAGNAGAFGKQIGDLIDTVLLMDKTGRVREEAAACLHFAYRRSRLQETGEAIVSARLRLAPASDPLALLDERQGILDLRRSKHPDWRQIPTAGSFFRNIEPTSAAARRQAAGYFLEQAGAKTMRVGGARVFEKHANILVTGGECRAQDVRELARRLTEAVREKFGFTLVPEVRLLGFENE